MKRKFSVLMCVYDKEESSNLDSSLHSIFDQTIKPNQVVVVQDGPLRKELTDILDKYKIERIELKEKVGLTNGLNIGLTKCKYNLVARMDSDDICMKNRFELLLREFSKDKKLVLAGGQIIEFDNNGLRKKRIVPTNKKDIYNFSKKRNPFNHMSVMYRKDIILKLGGYPKEEYFEDYYLWTKVLGKGYNVKNIDDIIIKARSGNKHIKRRGGLKYIKHIYKFEKDLYNDGFINYIEFITNLSERIIISILPNGLRKMIYSIFLRKWGGYYGFGYNNFTSL